MLTFCNRVYETAESVAEIIQRWQGIVVDEELRTSQPAHPTYGGYVTESGFYLTRRNYCFKKSISETICRGLFHSTHKGTSIELEVHIAPTMKRVLVLGVSCAAIAVPIAFVAIFWGNELPQPTYFLALVAVGLVMFLIGMIGAGLMIVCFLLVSAVVVRIVASRFRTEMMKR